MEGTKRWYKSKTTWGSIATIIVGLATSFGFLTEAQGSTIQGQFPELAVGVVTTALGVWNFFGRVVATKQLSA